MAERFVGRHMPRPDAADKATGKTHYIQDIERPGMLHGAIKFSEHPHARILHVDTSKAARLPGVRAVVAGQDTPEIRIGFLRDNFALKKDRVRSLRDEVAAVAAIDPDIAREALDLIEVEYEPLPGVFSPEEALAPGAPLLHETDSRGKPLSNNEVPLRTHHESGDLVAAERASRHIVEGEYTTARQQQACLGTAGCIAEMDAHGNLTVTAKTQIPFLAQRDFLRALASLGLEDRNARVIVPPLGGGFGSGLDTHAYEYIAILLAHRTGRPVKILYDREHEFSCLSPRQSARTHIVQGCDAEGRLTFRRVKVVQDNGAYTSWGATYPTVMLMPVTSLYRVPAVRFDAQLVYTNNTYCQAMRGYGNPEVTWAIESSLDELAEAAGIDAFDLRRMNTNRPNETTPMGLRVTTCGMPECLDAVATRLSWRERRGRGRNRARGVGLASLMHVGGSGRIYRSDGGGVALKLDDFGNVYVSCGGVEMGQGLHASLTATVADALGVHPGRVFINPTDTATCPWDVGTHASRGAFIACNAAIRACEKARQRIFELAAEVYPDEIQRTLRKQGGPPPEIDFAAEARARRFELVEGVLGLRDGPDDPRLGIELGHLLRAIHFRGDQGQVIAAEAFFEPRSELPNWTTGRGNLSATYAFGVQGVELEVDVETGKVRILRMAAAHDVGTVLQPQALRGQIVGALAQGVGYALYEEVKTERGRITNPSFRDYKLPTAVEMGFPIDIDLVETPDEAGPFGAKGVGEPGLVPTAPAIANAIYDAIGVRIRDLPITAEKIVMALRARKGEAKRG